MADETAVVAPQTYESRLIRFKEQWQRALPTITALLPAGVSAERLFSVAVTARQRNPALLECSDVSILRGIILGAQLGLDVSGVGGKCYLVPYKNVAQFQMGWRGLVELALRTGKIIAIYGREVYQGEEFSYEDGMVQRLQHIPSVGAGDPGSIVGAWAVAVFTNGFRQIEVMNRWQIDQVRSSSKATSGPWFSHYAQMAVKTVIKRLCKKLPDSYEMQVALEMEDIAETGQPQPELIELPELEPNVPAPTRTEQIKEQIGKVRMTQSEAQAAMEAAPPVKRGPGRPPKPKAPETMTAEQVHELTEILKEANETEVEAETDDAYDAD